MLRFEYKNPLCKYLHNDYYCEKIEHAINKCLYNNSEFEKHAKIYYTQINKFKNIGVFNKFDKKHYGSVGLSNKFTELIIIIVCEDRIIYNTIINIILKTIEKELRKNKINSIRRCK